MLHQLYRHFDADGTLLYVGMSMRALVRLASHRATSEWFRDISRVQIETFPSRWEAEEAERTAIETEYPIFNLKGAVKPRAIFDEEANELLRKIAKIRRDQPRNVDVMRLCSALEEFLIQDAEVRAAHFDRKSYMRDYMRKRRAKENQ